MPLPAVSGAKRSTKKPVSNPPHKPTPGSNIQAGINVEEATRQLPSHQTPDLSKTPASPEIKPIRQASKMARRLGRKKSLELMTLEGSLNSLGILMYGINSVDGLIILCSIAL